jgi:hypothetical protein
MSRITVALAGIVILSAAILAARSVPQAEDPTVLPRAAALPFLSKLRLADYTALHRCDEPVTVPLPLRLAVRAL